VRWTIDPARLWSKSRNTPFAGRPVQGRVEMTVCEGRIVHESASSSEAKRTDSST
jgi:dihydroorotase